MRNAIIIVALTFLAFIGGFAFNNLLSSDENTIVDNFIPEKVVEKPLERYTIENLSNANISPGVLTLGELLEENDTYNTYLFSMEFDPSLAGNEIKKTTGMINIPNGEGKYPLIVMFRGYVDQTIYQTGTGTKNAGSFFADKGFITIAPDFLGYAGSDTETGNIFESRFQTYVTALTLMKSLDQVDMWDGENLFIWGHSNGGQIAITVLEVTKDSIPATLWAPVTKPFPYSILYYTDESTDKGKFIRKELAEFEKLYDVEKYSLDNFVTNIDSILLIHQGTADHAVPVGWTDGFVQTLEEEDVDVTYYKYQGADHNLRPSWDTVVQRDYDFFIENLK
jgi:dipeptidyl aminopeptidase/acylaminoacyl peptidase